MNVATAARLLLEWAEAQCAQFQSERRTEPGEKKGGAAAGNTGRTNWQPDMRWPRSGQQQQAELYVHVHLNTICNKHLLWSWLKV